MAGWMETHDAAIYTARPPASGWSSRTNERTPVGVRRNDADCANTFCKAPYFIYPFLCIFAELELLDAD